MAAVFKRHDDVALRIITAGAAPAIQDKVKFYSHYVHVLME